MGAMSETPPAPTEEPAQPLPLLEDIDPSVAERIQGAPANLAFASLSGCFLVALLVVLGAVAAVLSLPTLREGNNRSVEREAIKALRALEKAQRTFKRQDSDGDGTDDYGTLAELGRAGLINADLASGVLRGFRLEVLPAQSEPGRVWTAVANRTESHSGRSFVLNQRGVIHYTWGETISIDAHRGLLPPGVSRMERREEERF